MNRINVLANHLNPVVGQVDVQPTMAAISDDVVICSAVRTPVCKAKRGGFKDTTPDILLSTALKGAIERANLDPKLVGDINVGNVLLQQGAIYARQAQALAGIPFDVPLSVNNRQCSSGIQACANIAAGIKSGQYECGIGCGVESMSLANMMESVSPALMSEKTFENDDARNCLMPMGITSENVASAYGITRKAQDTMAVESHAKAVKAAKDGLFADEIVPVATKVKDKAGVEKEVTISADDGCRADVTLEGLGKLKAAFQKDGSTTAGNASQVSDGAAAVVLASRSFAQKHNMPILAIFKGFAVRGVAPEVMGIGPAVAIPAALESCGLKISDIGVWEINEAFASQATYCVEKLGIDKSKVNPKGGAIALGHPLGATGSRQMATLLPELKRTNSKYGVISMCIGTGMGAAAVIERV